MRLEDRRCLRIAAGQLGLITHLQALDCGLSQDQIDYRLTTGQWRNVFPGVYAIVGVPESWEQRVLGATMWSRGPASHRTAGFLWGLTGIARGPIEVLTSRKLAHSEIILHRRSMLPDRVSSRAGIPVTDPTDTLLDLAAVLSVRPLEIAVDSALRMKLSHLRLLSERLEGRARQGRNGIRLMRAIIASRDPSYSLTQSELEAMFLRLVKRYRLPKPVPQFVIRDRRGAFVARPDFVYPSERIAIELQSYTHHQGRREWESDQSRFGDITALDWTPLPVTYLQMTLEPDRVAERVKRVLWSKSRSQSG